MECPQLLDKRRILDRIVVHDIADAGIDHRRHNQAADCATSGAQDSRGRLDYFQDACCRPEAVVCNRPLLRSSQLGKKTAGYAMKPLTRPTALYRNAILLPGARMHFPGRGQRNFDAQMGIAINLHVAAARVGRIAQ